MSIKKLEKLYKKYWDSLRLFRNTNGLSSPLLIKTRSKKIKLFIVGQETFGGWTRDSIKKCQNDYEETLIPCLKTEKPKKRYQGKWDTWSTYRSAFWRTVRTLVAELKINQEKEGIAWNNINRMDYKGHGPNNKLKRQMIEKFPLLRQEIKICKPEIIVFFTNQRYDKLLKQTFEKSKTKITFQKIKGFPLKKLAKITIVGFKGKAYRTYHPAYKQKKEVEKIISTIVKDFKN